MFYQLVNILYKVIMIELSLDNLLEHNINLKKIPLKTQTLHCYN